MSIRVLMAAAAVAVGMGSAADAALLYSFDATVLEAALYCEEGPGSCDLESLSGNYQYSLGETGQAFARVSQGMVWLTFAGQLLYEGEVSKFGNNSYASSYVEDDTFANWNLKWNELGGLFWYMDDGYPAWEHFELGLDNPTVAAVPLPATAALLPLGFGALALMRRRRRSA